jgi:drug/metabolite transporter (DMT)-like permease
MEAHETFQVNPGHLWLLVAAFLLSAYNILQRRLTKKYPPLTTVVYSILLGEILLFAFAPGALAEAKNAPGIQFLYLAVLGVFSSAVAYFTWAAALARAEKTSSVSNYMFLTPLLAALLGYWLIGEKPSPSTVMGGAIILAGLAVFNFGEAFMGFWKKPPV